jgi:hypothetical protein
LILSALAVLTAAAAADPVPGLPSQPFPALAAAPLVYVFVPDPLGANTWAERQIQALRLGAGATARDGGPGSGELLSFQAVRPPPDRPAEAPGVPRGEPVREGEAVPGQPVVDERRLLGAIEAMGLRPEDLVEAPELPAAALAFADFISRIDAFLFARRPRDRGTDIASLRVDPEPRHVKQPRYVRHKKPPPDPEPPMPPLTLYAKRITRSIYKVLLGVAIGILIWGFVRDSG